ncbi:MAG: 4Fe-4S dicluster domain-containing protein [Treponema sp.]|jgi:electron transport complex protein RnfC|nr:4Fe-4S dicluster domain-containing protein [Treponema sp.]
MKVYSFSKNGIRFEDSFAPEREHSSLAFLPEIAILPLSTESGSRSLPIVSIGQHIEEGMLIARKQDAGSSNIHSPIPGKLIKAIKWEPGEYFLSDALAIRLEGSFNRLGKLETKHEWTGLSQFEIKLLLEEYGVTEMDGLGRPLCDIFSQYYTVKKPLTMVLKCVFDDPWLVADYCLCRERMEAVAEGCMIAARASGASTVLLAVSAAEKELGEALFAAAKQSAVSSMVTLLMVLVGSRYPQHSDYEMEAVLRKYEKKEGIALSDIMFLGPATMAAIYDAVALHTPALERYVAAGGSAVKHRVVVRARIGSRLRDIFAECGGFCGKPDGADSSIPSYAVIGSPLMGRVVSLDEPILKTSRGVFAFARKKQAPPIFKFMRNFLPEAACIGCGECRIVCPVELDPEDLYKRIKNGKHDDSMISLILRCIGCGCCETVCPSKLPLCTAIIRSTFKGAASAV